MEKRDELDKSQDRRKSLTLAKRTKTTKFKEKTIEFKEDEDGPFTPVEIAKGISCAPGLPLSHRRTSEKLDSTSLPEKDMEKIIKDEIKDIEDFTRSKKPERRQLYILYKLLMNRKPFEFIWNDRYLIRLSKLLCCYRKSCVRRLCSNRYQEAEKKQRALKKGK